MARRRTQPLPQCPCVNDLEWIFVWVIHSPRETIHQLVDGGLANAVWKDELSEGIVLITCNDQLKGFGGVLFSERQKFQWRLEHDSGTASDGGENLIASEVSSSVCPGRRMFEGDLSGSLSHTSR